MLEYRGRPRLRHRRTLLHFSSVFLCLPLVGIKGSLKSFQHRRFLVCFPFLSLPPPHFLPYHCFMLLFVVSFFYY